MESTISLLDFCRNIDGAIARVEAGERLTLLREGKPVARLEPAATNGQAAEAGSFLTLHDLAEPGMGSLTNEEIDKIVYGI